MLYHNTNFIKELQLKILTKLPGIQTQLLMAPPTRNQIHLQVPAHARKGGVAVVLFSKANQWHVLLMQRTADGGKHSGQISFAGGKYDATDTNITYTAIRELQEEMGIKLNDISIIGTLTPLYIPPSNFYITPIVMHWHNVTTLTPSLVEVAKVIEIPLQELYAAATKTSGMVYSSFDPTLAIDTPMYSVHNQHNIWGATAMVLRELEELVM